MNLLAGGDSLIIVVLCVVLAVFLFINVLLVVTLRKLNKNLDSELKKSGVISCGDVTEEEPVKGNEN